MADEKPKRKRGPDLTSVERATRLRERRYAAGWVQIATWVPASARAEVLELVKRKVAEAPKEMMVDERQMPLF
jgi:hypothetical protein